MDAETLAAASALYQSNAAAFETAKTAFAAASLTAPAATDTPVVVYTKLMNALLALEARIAALEP